MHLSRMVTPMIGARALDFPTSGKWFGGKLASGGAASQSVGTALRRGKRTILLSPSDPGLSVIALTPYGSTAFPFRGGVQTFATITEKECLTGAPLLPYPACCTPTVSLFDGVAASRVFILPDAATRTPRRIIGYSMVWYRTIGSNTSEPISTVIFTQAE